MAPADFIEQLLPAAQACQRASRIPASFTLAQSWRELALGLRGYYLH